MFARQMEKGGGRISLSFPIPGDRNKSKGLNLTDDNDERK
jgi:hypothetical protein